jgi:hypothetical protein
VGSPICEACQSIDVRVWHSEGRLRAGESFPCSWVTSDGEPFGGILVKISPTLATDHPAGKPGIVPVEDPSTASIADIRKPLVLRSVIGRSFIMQRLQGSASPSHRASLCRDCNHHRGPASFVDRGEDARTFSPDGCGRRLSSPPLPHSTCSIRRRAPAPSKHGSEGPSIPNCCKTTERVSLPPPRRGRRQGP